MANLNDKEFFSCGFGATYKAERLLTKIVGEAYVKDWKSYSERREIQEWIKEF